MKASNHNREAQVGDPRLPGRSEIADWLEDIHAEASALLEALRSVQDRQGCREQPADAARTGTYRGADRFSRETACDLYESAATARPAPDEADDAWDHSDQRLATLKQRLTERLQRIAETTRE
jgi:hypothetical protein